MIAEEGRGSLSRLGVLTKCTEHDDPFGVALFYEDPLREGGCVLVQESKGSRRVAGTKSPVCVPK
jgi:hypothetical protein